METPETHNQALNEPSGEPQLPRQRAFHRKRSHRKSRRGCLNCKTRKVKCNEAFPTCRSCSLRKTDCVYQSSSAASHSSTFPSFIPLESGESRGYPEADPIALLIDPMMTLDQPALDNLSSTYSSLPPTHQSSISSSTSIIVSALDALNISTPSLSLEVPFSPFASAVPTWTATPLYTPLGLLPPSPSFDNVDLKLLWHYTVKTCTSFTVDLSYQRPIKDTFRTAIISYAFDAPFLMDNLFALACLDLQKFEPSFPRSRALAYRARAIEGYRSAVQAARPESFPALIANSLLLTAISSQNFRDPQSKDLYIIDWMLVWRGIDVIVDLVGFDTLLTSGLSIILFRPTIDLNASALAIPNYLFFMASSIPASDPDHPHIAAYIMTAKFLGSLYYHLHVGFGPDLNLRITTWLSYIPRAFIDLCQLRRPRALVILAHYAAFIKLVQDLWWLEGIGDRSIADIASYLDFDWQSLLRVPLAVSHETDKLSIARIILEDPTWTNPERRRDDVRVHFAVLSEEDPRDAAFHHLQREHQQDADMDLEVDADINRKLIEALS